MIEPAWKSLVSNKGILPEEMKILDPHFSEDINVIARFIPTDEGWELAIKCAKILEN
jgi:glutathionylspermidine synthase